MKWVPKKEPNSKPENFITASLHSPLKKERETWDIYNELFEAKRNPREKEAQIRLLQTKIKTLPPWLQQRALLKNTQKPPRHDEQGFPTVGSFHIENTVIITTSSQRQREREREQSVLCWEAENGDVAIGDGG
ncbi:hypothetical protein Patl1_14732 [Pistacia atlantica]|uniref:Uncharacterized protein n=1 Tax=Pistacia atlantica TaxID=434234 RepID=A0ACC1AUB1_9ROSI|nr:hypothetical protein Patl1_14732 [Pistacia atlantica]